MSKINRSQEQEITSLFNTAKDEIDKINHNADEKKKDIVVRLAKALEGKIPKETICMKIVEALDGKVSDTLIRDYLPQEYKQGYRRENAKKKKKKEPKLAPLLVLNPQKYKEVDEEEEKPEKKEVVMIGADGMNIPIKEIPNSPHYLMILLYRKTRFLTKQLDYKKDKNNNKLIDQVNSGFPARIKRRVKKWVHPLNLHMIATETYYHLNFV